MAVLAVFFCVCLFLQDVQKGEFRKDMPSYNTYYLSYVPKEYDKSKKWPLVLFLHGGNGRVQFYLDNWRDVAESKGYIMVVPRSRQRRGWPLTDDSLVLACIDDVKKTHNIDSDRIYLSGHSMGGHGTLNFGIKRHKLFAAIAPVSGYYQRRDLTLKDAKNLPVYLLIGASDNLFLNNMRGTRDSLTKGGFKVKYEEVPGQGHEYAKDYSRKILEWFESLLKKKAGFKASSLLKKAAAASKKGDYAKAIQLLKRIINKSDATDKLLEEARSELEKLRKEAARLVEKAQTQINQNQFDHASALLREVSKKFAGIPEAKAAQEKLAELLKSPAVRQKQAARLFSSAEESEHKTDYISALETYGRIIKDFPDTDWASKAAQRVKKLKADPALKKVLQEKAAASDCRKWLGLAESYEANGMIEKALRYYRMIVGKYPSSSHADAARKKISELEEKQR